MSISVETSRAGGTGTDTTVNAGTTGTDSTTRGATAGVASRQTTSSTNQTVLNTQYELREIVVAQGIEFRNGDAAMPPAWHMPDGLKRDFPKMTVSGGVAEYISERQRVRFTIRVVNTKDKFKEALQTAGVHVIYAGHARYGRGPCFGPYSLQSENWEQGSSPSTTGIHRMGYPIIGVHFSDIKEHGYSFLPVVSGAAKPDAKDCHPDIRLGALRKIALPTDLHSKVLPQGHPLANEFWGYKDGKEETVLLYAGWEKTISDPMDLGATKMVCRCFCHFGCNTFRHNWKIIRERKKWQRTETDKFAYFSTGSVNLPIELFWIKALFLYDKRNDYQSWYPSLQNAVAKVNARLAGYRRHYRVI